MMTEQDLFPVDMYDVLVHPERWRLISTAFPAEAPVAQAPRHQAWLAAHAHAHPHQEILLILGGQGCHSLDGTLYAFAPGCVFFFDAFERHDFNVPPWAPDADYLWLMLMEDHVMARHVALRGGALSLSERCNMLLSQQDAGMTISRCLTDIRVAAPAAVRRLRALAVVSGLLAGVLHAGSEDRRETDRETFQARIVAAVCAHIEETGGNGITLDHLARFSGYSKFHFLRLFQHYTGQSVHAYIDRCRLLKVRAMAQAGSRKTEIAAALGFAHPSAFSRWYRRWAE